MEYNNAISLSKISIQKTEGGGYKLEKMLRAPRSQMKRRRETLKTLITRRLLVSHLKD
jgi:hypothetical protein